MGQYSTTKPKFCRWAGPSSLLAFSGVVSGCPASPFLQQHLQQGQRLLKYFQRNAAQTKNMCWQIMKIEGYCEEFVDLVFDHLVQNEKLGKAFMAKGQRLRLIFLERFKKYWGVECSTYYVMAARIVYCHEFI
ncbi:unnamed protein product [Coffea canephora]|uniref:Uncharacterized protein n=1 Tax=Coffea canephora TaxID=49390 RepID=A0A068UB83_COFCA|nr:unnamed protein product [Coffea canephora]